MNCIMGMSRLPRVLVLLSVMLCLTACDTLYDLTHDVTSNEIDPSGHMYREDYQDLRERGTGLPAGGDEGFPPIPQASTGLTPPPAPAPAGSDRRVSITVTDAMPLRDVLIELARESKVNLELDPRIQGGIIFTAHNQPFNEVLKRICAMAGLRSMADGNFIKIEIDERWTPATDRADLHVVDVQPESVRLSIAMPGMSQREIVLKPHQTFQLSTGKVVEDSGPVPASVSR